MSFPRIFPLIIITNTNDVDNEYTILPSDCLYLKLYEWDINKLTESKGAILLANNTIGLIFSDANKWLDSIQLVKTNNIFRICIGQSYIPKDMICLDKMSSSYDLWAVLKILPSGKVDPIMIYNIVTPIQEFHKLNDKFNWIEEYYKEIGWPSGCGYYKQRSLDPYIRIEERLKKKPILPPSKPIEVKFDNIRFNR